MFKKILALVLTVCLVCTMGLVLGSCGGGANGMSESPLPIPAAEADFEVSDDFKIGFICLHDESSTYDKNFIDAVDRFQEALGLENSQVIIKRNIPETEVCYEAAIDLVSQGCKVIFANSFGHEPYILQAAIENPDVEFCHATGTKALVADLDNFHNAFASIYEGRFLAGIAAGLKLNEMIDNGEITADEAVIGYVGAYTYAEVISGYTSFYLGAKSVCPSVTMKVRFTGSWYDVTAEKNAAELLISEGCVLISQHADSMGAPGACEAAGVPNVSYNGSTYDACPETFIVSSAINWTPYYMYIAKCVANGEAIATNWCGGIEEGSVVLTGINQDVAAEGTLDAINDAIAKLKNGTLEIFDIDTFTVAGNKVTSYLADVEDNGDYIGETEVIKNGAFKESDDRSAPYFDLRIDGIELLNQKF